MIVGICGKSGSGKTTLAEKLIHNDKNISVIHLDIDEIGHQTLEIENVKEELITCFGDSIVQDGKIYRPNLSKIVFSSNAAMEKLTDITWKYMKKSIDSFLSESSNFIIILDWALLPKTEYFAKCDMTVLLDVPYEVRKQRVISRDSISDSLFDLRESASLDYCFRDFDIVDSDIEDIFERLVKFYE